jgi:hypothetical protein
MFGSRLIMTGVVLFLLIVGVALGAARPTSGAAPETRSQRPYTVRPGDTLWAIAASHYEGDPREAIWLIMERNGLETSALQPGEVLMLP